MTTALSRVLARVPARVSARFPARWLRRLGPSHLELGRRGERVAARYLRRRGYRIMKRNLTIGRDEADIVAVDPDGRTVVVVEVKTRRGDFAAPQLRIDRRKQHRLARLAARLLQAPEMADSAVRFDAIAIVWPPGAAPQVTHMIGAFDSPI